MKNCLYQIVLMGTSFFVEELKEKLNAYSQVQIVDEVNGNYPYLCLYFGQSRKDKICDDNSRLVEFASSNSVLPIVKDLKKFNERIPDCLLQINGLCVDRKSAVTKLYNYILSFFALIGKNRKVFISYRRSETMGLAHALFTQLSLEGFDPFLDTSSIEPGRAFQEELKHELVDSEVFVYLNSPDYMNSEYTQEELFVAQMQGLGIVQVVMPNQKCNSTVVCQRVVTVSENYDIVTLTNDIVQSVQDVRAASFAFRKKMIFDEFKSRMPDFRYGVSPNLYLNKDSVLQICTHIPKSTDIYEAEKNMMRLYPQMRRIVVFDAQYCKSYWQKHLNWLNQYLSIITKDVRHL